MNIEKLIRGIKYGSNSITFAATIIGIIIIINLFIHSFNIQWDLTRSKLYSLSNESKTLLKDIDEKVELLFFANPADSISLDIKQLYESISKVNKNISLDIIDPMKNPSLVNEYQINSEYTFVVSSNKRTKQIPYYDLIRVNYNTEEHYFDGETSLIQAILDVTAEKEITVYILEGHGEFHKDKELTLLTHLLEQKGIKVVNYFLAKNKDIPKDCDIIYIIGPQFDYSPDEIKLLENYLDDDGKMLLTFNAYAEGENLNNLKNLALNYGIEIEDSLLKDPINNYVGDEQALIPLYNSHDIVKKLMEDNIATIIPRARKLSIKEKSAVTNNVVFETSEGLPFAITAEKEIIAGKKAQLLVIGNSFFAHDEIISIGGNIEIFFGALSWFREDSNIVDIPPKTYTPKPIVLVGTQPVLIFIVCIFLMPLFVFLFGGIVYFRRRAL